MFKIGGDELLQGRFIRRPNRFVAIAEVMGEEAEVHMPNPGRLVELLVPNCPIWVRKAVSPSAKLPYSAVGVERMGTFVPLDTIRMNSAAEWLISNRLIEPLAECTILRREVPVGPSRFDFLLQRRGKSYLLEVKCCTLFNRTLAMFPDAPTTRGTAHVEHLRHLAQGGQECGVLFIVQSLLPGAFLPDWHTDLPFARAMSAARGHVDMYAAAVSWNEQFELGSQCLMLPIPWHVLDTEMGDGGCYVCVFHLPEERVIPTGALGDIRYPAGYYAYTGSAVRGLDARIRRHMGRHKRNLHWHIDYFSREAKPIRALPIRTSSDMECSLARSLNALAHWTVPGFGCSDCGCSSHLFGFRNDPSRDSGVYEQIFSARTVL